MLHKGNSTSGFCWSLTSVVFWASVYVVSKHLLADNIIDPITLTLVRFILGGLILLAYCLVRRKRQILLKSAGDYFRVSLLGLFGIAGMSLLFFYGQTRTTAVNASILMQLCPLMIITIGILCGEKISLVQIIGFAVSLAGCLIAIGALGFSGFCYSSGYARGDMLILAAALCWAYYTIYGRKSVRKYGEETVTMWAMIFGAAWMIAPALLLSGQRCLPHRPADWLAIAYIGIFPTAIAFLAWYKAMEKLNLWIVNIMQYLTPGFTIIMSYFLIGESISLLRLAGFVVTIVGMLLVWKKSVANTGYAVLSESTPV